jgi:hypothetical protein
MKSIDIVVALDDADMHAVGEVFDTQLSVEVEYHRGRRKLRRRANRRTLNLLGTMYLWAIVASSDEGTDHRVSHNGRWLAGVRRSAGHSARHPVCYLLPHVAVT